MNSSLSRQRRQQIFAWVVLGSIVLAISYTVWVMLRADVSPNAAQGQAALQPTAHPEELATIQTEPHLIFLHPVGPHYGQVTVAGLDADAPQIAPTDLRCDRMHFAASNGICLIEDTSTTPQDVLSPTPTLVKLFGPDFQLRHQFEIDGLPSRARVSPDGKYAAYTVFVAGHSYADANMSTATVLLETATGTNLGNLEEFEVWKDGQVFNALDFNFWGVTFAQDSDRFYATLRSQNITYLVQGNITDRKLTVVRENVECPSLSPDGTRIAFKKLTPSGMWQLTVLNLATMQEILLAEKESIDDQVEWLDNGQILYQRAEENSPMVLSLFVIPADGSGQPQVFMPRAESPAVVRK